MCIRSCELWYWIYSILDPPCGLILLFIVQKLHYRICLNTIFLVYIYVTGFIKIDPNHTRNEIHRIAKH